MVNVEYQIAIALGSIIGAMLDLPVFAIGVIAGLIGRTRVLAAYSLAGAVVLVMAIKMPVIYDMAERLGIPDPSILGTALTYGVAIAVIMSVVTVIRVISRQITRYL